MLSGKIPTTPLYQRGEPEAPLYKSEELKVSLHRREELKEREELKVPVF
jgi:hypothetical protein